MKTPALLLAALTLLAVGCTNNMEEITALQQRVQQLEDQEAIRQVLIDYGEHLDARDYEAYANLFAIDGTWTGGFGSASGHAAIVTMLETSLGKPEPGFVNKSSFHLVTTMQVQVTGDAAMAQSRYMFYTATPENRPNALLAGRYEDSLVRENGQWKIKARTSHGVIPWRDGNAPSP